MNAIQLDFFKSENECEMDALRRDLEKIRRSSDNVRKGTYAKINEYGKRTIDLELRLEILERHICKGIIHVGR